MKHFNLSFKLARRPNLKNSPKSLLQVPVPRVSDRQGSQQPWTLTFWNPKVVQSSSLSGHFFCQTYRISLRWSLTVLLYVLDNVLHQCRNLVSADCVRSGHLLQWNAKNPRGAGRTPALIAWQWRHAPPHGLLLTTTPTRPHVCKERHGKARFGKMESFFFNLVGFFLVDAAQQRKPKNIPFDFCSAIYKQIHDRTEPQARRESLVYTLLHVSVPSVQTLNWEGKGGGAERRRDGKDSHTCSFNRAVTQVWLSAN